MADISSTLAQLPLLRGMEEDALSAVATAGVPIRLAAGDVLVRQGELGDTLYLLMTGALVARVRPSEGDVEPRAVAWIMPGEVVGELALLASIPRSADVVAIEDSSLLMFDRVHALGLLGAHPVFARRVMAQIATRLAHTVAAPASGQGSSRERVSAWRLKAGSEAALRAALAAAPTGVPRVFAASGVRRVRFYQRDRLLVRVWSAEGMTEDTVDPAALDAIASLTATIWPLLEEPGEEAGAGELIYEWLASAMPASDGGA
jgi:CRP-like cAMP-binding protein